LKTKERLASQLERERAATKFDFEATSQASSNEGVASQTGKPREAVVSDGTGVRSETNGSAAANAGLSYTERLLEAKRKAKK
jgi:hypothetical protein